MVFLFLLNDRELISAAADGMFDPSLRNRTKEDQKWFSFFYFNTRELISAAADGMFDPSLRNKRKENQKWFSFFY